MHERPSGPLGDPEAASLPLGEGGDDEVRLGLDKRTQVSAKVGVAQEERALRGLALAQRERLALAASRQPDDARACALRLDRGPVARPVVGDDHLRLGKLLLQRRDGRRDRVLLVARCDEDRCGLTHSAAPRRGGTIPSSAVSLRP